MDSVNIDGIESVEDAKGPDKQGSLRFERIPNPGLKANLLMSLGVVALIIALGLLGIFVNQGFALPAVMILFCFGRFLFTGSCPAVRVMGRLSRLMKSVRGRRH